MNMKQTPIITLLCGAVLVAGCATSEVGVQTPGGQPAGKAEGDQPRSRAGNPVVRLELTALHRSSGGRVRGYGSGFFITRDGYLVTNDHVVHPVKDGERCQVQSLMVRINQGRDGEHVVPGKVVAFDHAADLAVVKVSGSRNRPVLRLSRPGALRKGSTVRAQGYPRGGPYKETKGAVFAMTSAGGKRPTGIIYCSAPVQPGNSGGPVLDERGMVVGVAVAMSDVRFQRSMKQVQDAAASGLADITAALERAQQRMKAQGDRHGYADRFGAMAVQGRKSLRDYAERSWILEEAVKHPHKTHAIDVTDLHKRLAKWGVSAGN